MRSGNPHVCAYIKPSNYGDILKSLVPNYMWKYISGWSNYSGKVISWWIIERAIDYRVSKSIFGNLLCVGTAKIHNKVSIVVKEQRLDGGCIRLIANSLMLRYSLMGLERDYQIKIPSNIIRIEPNIRSYSTDCSLISKRASSNLDPWFVTGFCDGESCFYVGVPKSNKSKIGYNVELIFTLALHEKDRDILEQIKNYFGVGYITQHGKNTLQYRVKSVKDLNLIVEHFENYPLQTTKHVHFILWSRVLNMIENKEHIVESGLLEILAIKSLYPTGLNENLKEAFPNIVSIEKPEFVANTTPLNGHWVAGFTQADGSFGLSYFKVSKMKLGYTGQASFRVTQHERDLIVLNRIKDLLGYGSVRIASKIKKEWVFSVTNNLETVSSFFKEYPIYGTKQLDFECFNKGVLILKNKEHLTPEGLMEFKTLVDNMNSSRSV